MTKHYLFHYFIFIHYFIYFISLNLGMRQLNIGKLLLVTKLCN